MKRGSSGLSLVVGVNKPAGMTSHDVVNRCRRIFDERRVGHTGTLDPMATGVLPICVGPATRLDAYLTGHDKRYRVRIAFGAATTTDDAEGDIIRTGEVPACVLDPAFATSFVEGLVGARKQLPPAYSAIKVEGRKACDAARQGTIIDLAPRDIVVHEARLLAVRDVGDDSPYPSWDVEFFVSKGTYIRSLARDAGVAVGCPAHVAALERTQIGLLRLEECVTLETLAEQGPQAALDPVRLLGVRFIYADGALTAAVRNGNPLPADAPLFERRRAGMALELCACTAGVRESCTPPEDGEVVAVIGENKLVALYAYEQNRDAYRARCVFQTGVSRGGDI
ncbi:MULTISPECIES: tRNA pseudouridine(55) synthase TruB [Gordonibacter]|uniref:tRNA pseudouridine synthase B n=1 Tax=Gordonibacter faecis TaxID=3047475 RepID=A0ABT7DIT0_9ACTN|nr:MULTISPECIES: tRNA pseudouridine(55) synthase TruB [unclassified Gordonibacter]MDJ1649438.1 tRNA pseudouridine(55) synthase TruB [Gordonibacter sp. KGMB12511]HIW75098.1 tRNA pseudouridine(55) synthase TruB [Candidatus Gordonibacter avicola]